MDVVRDPSLERFNPSEEKHDKSVHFITFANTSYMSTHRIVNEATSFGFTSIQSLTENDIRDFVHKHKDFIQNNRSGYGLWIWKPKIILDRLLSMKDGEILLYCDAGMYLNINGLDRYHDYLNILNMRDVLTFSLNDKYIAQSFVKRDVIDSFYPEFATAINRYCYAGVMMMKKTEATIRLVRDWLNLCETYNFIDRSESSLPEYPFFVGNDGDNGLFNLCLAKHNISHSVYPDETNIYDINGDQNYHGTPTDWDVLHKYPFQCRRIRPARQ